jgi:hypothetical protein
MEHIVIKDNQKMLEQGKKELQFYQHVYELIEKTLNIEFKDYPIYEVEDDLYNCKELRRNIVKSLHQNRQMK